MRVAQTETMGSYRSMAVVGRPAIMPCTCKPKDAARCMTERLLMGPQRKCQNGWGFADRYHLCMIPRSYCTEVETHRASPRRVRIQTNSASVVYHTDCATYTDSETILRCTLVAFMYCLAVENVGSMRTSSGWEAGSQPQLRCCASGGQSRAFRSE